MPITGSHVVSAFAKAATGGSARTRVIAVAEPETPPTAEIRAVSGIPLGIRRLRPTQEKKDCHSRGPSNRHIGLLSRMIRVLVTLLGIGSNRDRTLASSATASGYGHTV